METTTIIAAQLADFVKSLARHQKLQWHEAQDGQRQHQIATSVSSATVLTGKVTAYFWEVYNRIPVRDRPDHVDYQRQFFAQHCKVRLGMRAAPDLAVPEAVCGYIVLDGELLGMHSVIRGQGDWLLGNAIGDGATHLNCHAVPHLLDLYKGRGFYEYDRKPDVVADRPDVVWMRRDAS